MSRGDRLRTLRERIESIEGKLVETEDAVSSWRGRSFDPYGPLSAAFLDIQSY